MGELIVTGKEARDFIRRHFPNASIPGPVHGFFDAEGGGFAECYVPAMGGLANGEMSYCKITYPDDDMQDGCKQGP